MAKLYQGETVITEFVTSVVPGYDTIKTTNRLLNGEWFTQTIGTGARMVNVSLICNLAGKVLLDEAEAIGAPLTVTADGKYYVGVMRDSITWENLKAGNYGTTIMLLSNEEGDT